MKSCIEGSTVLPRHQKVPTLLRTPVGVDLAEEVLIAEVEIGCSRPDTGHVPRWPFKLGRSLLALVLLAGWLTSGAYSFEQRQAPERGLQVMVFVAPAQEFEPGKDTRIVDVTARNAAEHLSHLALYRINILPVKVPEFALDSFDFLDAQRFEFSDSDIRNRKTSTQTNSVYGFKYGLTPLEWSSVSHYLIRLKVDGRFRSPELVLEGMQNQTKFIAIKQKSGPALVIAMVPGQQPDHPSSKQLAVPEVIHQTLPSYPRELLQKRQVERVKLQVVVSEDGRVDGGRVVLVECPHRLFGINALAAMTQWRFKPGNVDGIPAKVRALVELEFRTRQEITPVMNRR